MAAEQEKYLKLFLGFKKDNLLSFIRLNFSNQLSLEED
jgi:hypothetical protein